MEKMTNNKKTRILLLPGAFNSPPARFRIWQFVEPLKAAGYEVTVRVPVPDRLGKGKNNNRFFWKKLPNRLKSILRVGSSIWMIRDIHKFEYVISNRDIIPELKLNFLEKKIIQKGVKFIFDFDDAIHLGKRETKLASFLPDCYYITPGNKYLAEYALTLNQNVQIIPTVVNTLYYKPISSRPPGKPRVGWSGSSSTNIYCLPILKDIIEELAKDIDFEFIVISNEDPKINWKGVQSRFIKWKPETEVADLQILDIGLMPLEDNPFEQGKCGLKAIQYMGVGIPALVSPVGVNQQIVTPEVDGYHCKTKGDWINNIKKLILDSDIREKMGANARAKVEKIYSVEAAMIIFKKLLNNR